MLQKRIAYFLLVVTLFVLGCDISTLIAPAAIPTTAQGSVETIVAQTAAVAATLTAKEFTPTLTPSFTPFPTHIPSATPTETPTFIFHLISPTATNVPILITPLTAVSLSNTDFECQVIGQTPADGTTMASQQDFQTVWTVANSGRKTWDNTSVDFIFLNGTKLSKSKAADLPKTVEPGGAVTLKLSMTAPKNPGAYTTVWALRIGQNEFCTMSVKIVVP
jgi:hypothetical protein